MNRKYDTSKFKEIVNKLKAARKDISLTTDVIVGFPTEDDNDYIDSVNYIKEIGFSKIHVFPYSVRNNTKAALLKQLPDNVKKERTSNLIKVSEELQKKYNELFLNQELDVLFEQSNKEYTMGHTSNYIEVRVKKDDNLIGKIVKSRLNNIENDYILGEIVDK